MEHRQRPPHELHEDLLEMARHAREFHTKHLQDHGISSGGGFEYEQTTEGSGSGGAANTGSAGVNGSGSHSQGR